MATYCLWTVSLEVISLWFPMVIQTSLPLECTWKTRATSLICPTAHITDTSKPCSISSILYIPKSKTIRYSFKKMSQCFQYLNYQINNVYIIVIYRELYIFYRLCVCCQTKKNSHKVKDTFFVFNISSNFYFYA